MCDVIPSNMFKILKNIKRFDGSNHISLCVRYMWTWHFAQNFVPMLPKYLLLFCLVRNQASLSKKKEKQGHTKNKPKKGSPRTSYRNEF